MEKLMKWVVIVLCCLRQTKSGNEDQRYKVGDDVPLYVNTVGSFQNPREKYSYYDLPFCQPEYFRDKKQTLGQALNGDHFIEAPYKLQFRVDRTHEIACRKNLTREEVSQFRTAIHRNFAIQMLYDNDLPVWSAVGTMNSRNQYALFNLINFDISYYKDRVVEIHVPQYPISLVEITEDKGVEVEFYYHVHWNELAEPFEKRMGSYFSWHIADYQLYLILNTSISLIVFSALLLKRYFCDFKINLTAALSNLELASDQEDRGWKSIQDNVFEFPSQKSLLCAMLGSGAHLLTVTMLTTMLGLFHEFHPHDQGPLLTAMVIIYAVTSIIPGYTSGSFYYHLEGTNWIRNMLVTGCLFMGPLCITVCLVNAVATHYKAAVALSFYTFFQLFLVWTLVALPMLLVGGILGRRYSCKIGNTELRAPLKVKKVTRQKIPESQWHSCRIFMLDGLIVFISVYGHLPMMMDGMWGFGGFTRYSGVSFVAFLLALLEMAVLSSILTAYKLVREDPNWWWRSFFGGGAVGGYVYAYCIYYYFTSTEGGSGSLQTSFFFGYVFCVCYAIFLIFGSVSFVASFLFVRLVYRPVKAD